MNQAVAVAFSMALLVGCGKGGSSEVAGGASEPAHQPRLAQMTSDAAKQAGIELSIAGSAPLREVLPLYGVIQPNAEHLRNVSARFPGVVRSVQAVAGQFVKKGDVLATVESNDSLQTYPVTAPIAGVITMKAANPGESVADQPMFIVTDLSTVWVELTLFPKDLSRVHQGQNVRVKAVDGNLDGSARVIWVSSVGESASQSVSARALLPNPARQWKPGLYVSGEVALSESIVPVAVKAAAIQTLDEQTVVFVAAEKGYAPRPVHVGRSDKEIAEILDGLKAGEQYVSVNSFVIKAEIEKGPAQEQD